MTVSTTSTRNDYTGTGSASVFSYTFPIVLASDLGVYVIDASGTSHTLAQGVDYSLTGAGSTSGGAVTLINSSQVWLSGGNLATGCTLTLIRQQPLTQTTSIRNQGAFYPDVIENTFDANTLKIQQLQEQLSRVPHLAVTDTGGIGPLPNIATRASKVLGFDSSGNPVAVTGGGGGGTSQVLPVYSADASYPSPGEGSTYYNSTLGLVRVYSGSAWASVAVGTTQVSAGGTGVTVLPTSPSVSAFAAWDTNKNFAANSLINGFATTATAGGTTTLTAASAGIQIFTGSAVQTVVLPVASTLTPGQQFTIVNLSTGLVTVQSSGANTIQALAANTQLALICRTASGTGTSSWAWAYVPSQSGTLPISQGGTGASSQSGAFSALAPTATGSGQLITWSGTAWVAQAPSTSMNSGGSVSGAVTVAAAAGDWEYTVTGNVTFDVTSLANGSTIQLLCLQSVGGNHTYSFTESVLWGDAGAPTPSSYGFLDRIVLTRELNGYLLGSYATGYQTPTGFTDTYSMLFTASSHQNVSFGNNLALDYNQAFTISMWIKPTSLTGIPGLFTKQNGSYVGYEIWLNGNALTLDMINNAGTNNRLEVQSNTAVTAGVWTHIAITHDGTGTAAGIKMYLNGSSVSLTTNYNALTASIANTGGCVLGSDTAGSYFTGGIDEFSLYSTNLTSTQVSEIYNSGTPVKLTLLSSAPNLAHWYRLGDSGDAITTNGIGDQIGSVNGTPVNMTSANFVADVP